MANSFAPDYREVAQAGYDALADLDDALMGDRGSEELERIETVIETLVRFLDDVEWSKLRGQDG